MSFRASGTAFSLALVLTILFSRMSSNAASSYRQKLWMREKGDVPFWGS